MRFEELRGAQRGARCSFEGLRGGLTGAQRSFEELRGAPEDPRELLGRPGSCEGAPRSSAEL
eukprot:7101592-Alexandrium_andersonii.AAC.1